MTKARTTGAKRRAKASSAAIAAAVELAGGVTISAARKDKRPSSAARVDPGLEDVARRRLALMRWQDTPANRRVVLQDTRMGTLYGRLRLCNRLGRLDASSETQDDAHNGIAELDGITRRYRRLVLGATIAGEREETALAPDFDLSALASRWLIADGALTAQGPDIRDAVVYGIAAGPDVSPDDVSPVVALRMALGGLAMARHFGLRA